MTYSDFYKNYNNFIGKKYRIVGLLNGRIVKSCWRSITEHKDLSEKPKENIIKNISVEIK